MQHSPEKYSNLEDLIPVESEVEDVVSKHSDSMN